GAPTAGRGERDPPPCLAARSARRPLYPTVLPTTMQGQDAPLPPPCSPNSVTIREKATPGSPVRQAEPPPADSLARGQGADCPAASDVRPRPPQVQQQLVVRRAAGVFQGVG